MSERESQITDELRATAPRAPETLRSSVLSIAARQADTRPRPRQGAGHRFGLRPALALGAAALLGLTAAAALYPRSGGDDSQPRAAERLAARGEAATPSSGRATGSGPTFVPVSPNDVFTAKGAARATLPPARRLQDYRATIRLRVRNADDLSVRAQQAMRDARRMGGFVASVDFATQAQGGDATLVLRVPVTRIQEAVARFSELGTILAQQVAIEDLQPQADRLATTIARHRARIEQLEAKARRVALTPGEQYQLDAAREQLRALTQQRTRLVRQARYATVRVALTTARAQRQEQTGPFAAFWDDAKKILTTEAVWLLYALVVAGPFILLAALIWLAERARRRRSNDALLAHH